MRALVALPVCALLALPACGGGDDGDLEAFCADVATLLELDVPLEQLLLEGTPEDLEARLGELRDIHDRIDANAPSEVGDELDTIGDALDEIDRILAEHQYQVREAAPALAASYLGDPERQKEITEAGNRFEFFGELECDLDIPDDTGGDGAGGEPADPPTDENDSGGGDAGE